MIHKIKGLWKLIFGRTTILIALLLIQIVVLVGGFAVLEQYVFLFNYLFGFLSLLVIFFVLNARQNSIFKMTWILLILIAPLFGVVFYIFTKIQPGTKYIEYRLATNIDAQEPYLRQSMEVTAELRRESQREAGLAKYVHEKGNYPIYRNSQVKYFPLGEDKFEEMVVQLKQAREFIFMEYFIVDKGYMWTTILKILQEKVKEGVEVRFMYDGTCSLTLLPPNYPERLKKLGIQCKMFAPVKPFLSTHQNNRDHRKILVIDGHTAFTGGVNIADEYINRIERFGHWKDTAIMIKGEAVKSFTLMFLQMWDIRESPATAYHKYIRNEFRPEPSLCSGGYILPYGDSPYDYENVGEYVYMDILYSATRYVHIMTPYLILDDEMITALTYAAKRGVEVIIIMPHIPDKLYAYLLARTYYPELIDAGVQIYEYVPGFVHAKVFSSDDEKAVVGTINLDFRSLYLHFECAAYIYRNPVVYEIESDFQDTLQHCRRITMKNCRKYNILKRIAGRILRIIAPLM